MACLAEVTVPSIQADFQPLPKKKIQNTAECFECGKQYLFAVNGLKHAVVWSF